MLHQVFRFGIEEQRGNRAVGVPNGVEQGVRFLERLRDLRQQPAALGVVDQRVRQAGSSPHIRGQSLERLDRARRVLQKLATGRVPQQPGRRPLAVLQRGRHCPNGPQRLGQQALALWIVDQPRQRPVPPRERGGEAFGIPE